MKIQYLAIFLIANITFNSANGLEAFTASSEDYPPYEYMEHGEFKGLDIEIIRAVSKRLGITANIQFLPWSRAMQNVKMGRDDAIFPVFKTKEREKFLYYPSENISSEKNVLIVKYDSNKSAKSIEDIRGWRIGVAADNSYGEEFDNFTEIIRDTSVNNDALIKKLKGKKRLDAIIMNELVFDMVVKQKGYEGWFRKLEYVPNEAGLYIAFSKEKGESSKKLAEQFGSTLKQLKKEGVIQKILDKYLVN